MTKTRLDKFLAQKYPQFSRSVWQKIIKKGLVLVDQKPVEPGLLLKEDGQIKIDWLDIKKPQGVDLNQKSDIILKVIFENQDFLIIEKPAGIVTHPTKIGQKNTLVNIILDRYPEIKKVGDDPLRPGIVHRLDKDVSGLMVAARTQAMYEHLVKQFKENIRVQKFGCAYSDRTRSLKATESRLFGYIKKEYLALVYGQPPAESDRISLPIAQVRGSLKRVAITSPRSKKIKKEKEAITEYQVIKKFAGYTLLKIKTLTGRTHQIRVHLKAIGCPIVGDRYYKFKMKNALVRPSDGSRKKLKIDSGRIFLHANYLGFYDLEGQWREFKSGLPRELNNFLKNLN